MIAFIVQARLGSTRLPNKIILPFYNDKSIFELLLEKLSNMEDIKCVVATSTSPANDRLEQICRLYDITCFRGDENDVLERFINVAEENKVDKIIRICSDNPFLNVPAILELIKVANSSDVDYISFSVNGTPSIKTHYGFWAEYVTLEALKRVRSLTSESLYHEHVTNYIYSNPNLFNIEWLKVPSIIVDNSGVRLTIDTPQDFENARTIYTEIQDRNSFDELFEYINSHPKITESMKIQITQNTK